MMRLSPPGEWVAAAAQPAEPQVIGELMRVDISGVGLESARDVLADLARLGADIEKLKAAAAENGSTSVDAKPKSKAELRAAAAAERLVERDPSLTAARAAELVQERGWGR